MDIKIVSSITRLANYMPLGSYVIYTALETYSFSLGATPAPVQTIVQTPNNNYTCLYTPGAAFTYTTCTPDQSDALKISLAIGFFLAVFLSFLKQVPRNGTPPLAPKDDEDENGDGDGGGEGTGPNKAGGEEEEGPQQQSKRVQSKRKKIKRKYRRGVVYAEGNFYYLDFGDYHVWGHALLSFVAFGTLSLFSASVSSCLFPKVRPWVFVFTQIILLVVCCFIAMFWIDDPSLSIGLMVVPSNDDHPTPAPQPLPPSTPSQPPLPPSNNYRILPYPDLHAAAAAAAPTSTISATDSESDTDTGKGTGMTATITTVGPRTSAAAVKSYASNTSATTLPLMNTNITTASFALSPEHSATSAGLANVALANTLMNSAMSVSSPSEFSTTSTAVGGGGGGEPGAVVNRMSMSLGHKGHAPTMLSVHEQDDLELELDERIEMDAQVWEERQRYGQESQGQGHCLGLGLGLGRRTTTEYNNDNNNDSDGSGHGHRVYQQRGAVASGSSLSPSDAADESKGGRHLSLKME